MYISVQSSGVVPGRGDMESGYRMIRDAGFEALDWNLDLAWSSRKIKNRQLEHCIFEDSLEEIQAHYARELAAIRACGLVPYQAHAPFPPYVQGFPELNDYAIGIYRQCIRYCDSVGIKYLVIHGISLIVDDETQTAETVRQMNLHLYESLIPVLRETNVVVCLENLFSRYRTNILMEGFCSVPEEAVWFVDHLNEMAGKECFGFCLDTGHLNLLGKNQGVFIRKLGKRIKALHMHDNRGGQDEHLAPYTGSIIWKDVIGALRDIGYEGSLNFETFRQVEPSRTDAEVAPIYLKTIHDIGCVFRDWIERA